ncbi:MAG TPA: hypothetical protein VEW46_22505 [Pyrinomonadaceae bacterium]|nr:hypothetical protein [Pyrinomonadaceae bacterium]
MKVSCSIFLLFFLGSCASTQVVSNPLDGPGLKVVQKKWRMEVRNPALERDPFEPNKQREQEVIAQKEAATQNESRIRQGLPTLPPVSVRAPQRRARGLSFRYIYEVKVTNTGEKKIRTLIWEYIFFEPGTEREVGRRQFVSKVSISPGRTTNVVMRSTTSPTGTVDATNAGKKPGDQYSEQIVIRSVGYADGSSWQQLRIR